MALLENKSVIVPTVLIDLKFEDGIRKVFPVELRDIIRVSFNKSGLATTIQGKVTSINAATTAYTYHADGVCTRDTTYATNKNGPYMVIDGSGTYSGHTETVYLGTIIDCDMISKWSDNAVVTSPESDASNKIESIDQIRLRNGKFEVSTDFGETWKEVEVSVKVNLNDDNSIEGVLPVRHGGTGRAELDEFCEDIGAQRKLDPFDTIPTENSTALAESGGIYAFVEERISSITNNS